MACGTAAQHQALSPSSCPASLSSVPDDPLPLLLSRPPSPRDEALFNLTFGDEDLDLYEQYAALDRELASLERREERVRKDVAALRREERRAQSRLAFVAEAGAAAPLVVAHLDELVGGEGDHAVVTVPETGRILYVSVQQGTVGRALLVPGASRGCRALPPRGRGAEAARDVR